MENNSLVCRQENFQTHYYKLSKWSTQALTSIYNFFYYACNWCNTIYGFNKDNKIVAALMYSENIEDDFLKIMGTCGDKGILYLVTNHPYVSCIVVSHFISKQYENNSIIRNISLARSLCHHSILDNIVESYILKGENEENYNILMGNGMLMGLQSLKFKFTFTISETSTFDQLKRLIETYKSVRRLIYQRNDLLDHGKVILTNNTKHWLKKSSRFEIIITNHPSIDIVIPFRCPTVGIGSIHEHNSVNLLKLQYFWQHLNLYYHIYIKLFPKRNICWCISEIHTLNGQYSIKNTTPIIYEKPKGLFGLCIDRIQTEFHWRPYELNKQLPSHIVKLYFQ